MGLFNFLRKSSVPTTTTSDITGPYKDSSTNFIYQLLFCDDPALYKLNQQSPYSYPFDILFSPASATTDLQKIIDDTALDSRTRLLAYNRQLSSGHKPTKKELLGVIVEVGLDLGLDVLASFRDGTARYINQTGKVLIWETTTDTKANELTAKLFARSEEVISKIGPWDKPRLRHPSKDKTRISFLVSDGLYFGEAPTDVLFNDELAAPALAAATSLMQCLTQMSLQSK